MRLSTSITTSGWPVDSGTIRTEQMYDMQTYRGLARTFVTATWH
jgi:hypothetical protein